MIDASREYGTTISALREALTNAPYPKMIARANDESVAIASFAISFTRPGHRPLPHDSASQLLP